jgi:hypothetical protein
MKHFFTIFLTGLLIVGFYVSANATTYYVDYKNGNDANNGVSADSSWMHAPGDPLANINPSTVTLNPGDIVMFRGGVVYRGTITMKYSGAAGVPITYRGSGWGSAKAIIDGSDLLSGEWQTCQSSADAGGNLNWQNIYYKTYTGTISPFTQVFENGERAYIAQTPNMSDPFWDDRISEYLPVTPANITLTSITDHGFLNQSTVDYWNGGYIQIWINPNIIGICKITAFNPANNTIYYETLDAGSLYGDRNQYYSIVNHLAALDRPGEYAVDEANKKIFYWPRGNINSCELSISTRQYGIGTNNNSYICIEGFLVRGFTDDAAARAIWNNRTWGDPSHDVTIRNNEITHIRTKDGRKGSITAGNLDGVAIEDNYIHHCQRNSGILAGGSNIIIRNNRINKVGYKGIWTMGASNLQILHNTVDECQGTHGNPVSVFTTANSLIADNYLDSGGEVFTFEINDNMVLHNNIIFAGVENGTETGSNLVRQNGSATSICHGYTIITNNTILYSNTNSGIGITQYFDDLSKVIIKNNITDGAPGGTTGMSMSASYNIYTGLSWSQEARYGWNLREGEVVETNLDTIFINPSANDFRLLEDSPARNAGIDLTTIIPQEIKDMFPDYNFTKDCEGNPRGIYGHWDIGALEYQDPKGDNNHDNIPSVYALYQNYPNPFNPSTTIKYYVPYASHVKIIIYDLLGRQIRTLFNDFVVAGIQSIEWDGTDSHGNKVSSGVYFYQLKTGSGFTKTQKMISLN